MQLYLNCLNQFLMIMITIYITSTTLGSKSYLFLSDRLPLKSMEQSLSMDKIERPQCSGRYIFDSYLGKFCTQLLLILNNIFPFRLRKTVSIATTTPPKHIPAFDKKSSFDIKAVSRRKHDQKIPAIFENLERVHHQK